MILALAACCSNPALKPGPIQGSAKICPLLNHFLLIPLSQRANCAIRNSQPQFRVRTIDQSNPITGQTNTLIVSLTAGGILRPLGDPFKITISGLRGAVITDGAVALRGVESGNLFERFFCDANGTPGLGAWNSADYSLTLSFCQYWTMKANLEYAFSIDVVNSEKAQASPTVTVSAIGGAAGSTISAMEMETSAMDITTMGSDGETATIGSTAVLRLVPPTLIKRSIQQKTASQGVENILSFIFQFNIDVDYSLQITVSGLNSDLSFTSQPADTSQLTLNLLPEDCGEGAEDIFCGAGGAGGTADWDSGNIVLSLCPNEMIEKGTIYRFGIGVVNPTSQQQAPTINITATGSGGPSFPLQTIIAPSSKDFDGKKDTMANQGLRDALRIEPQGFQLRILGQSNTVTGESNTITVSLVSSKALSGSGGQTIVISGLTGMRSSIQGATQLQIDPPQMSDVAEGEIPTHAQSFFCLNGDPADSGIAAWDSASDDGTLSLRLCPDAAFSEGVLYGFSFSFTNGPYPQESPDIQIAFSGSPDTFEATTVQKASGILNGITGGAGPLKLSNPSEVSVECMGGEWSLECNAEIQFPQGASDFNVSIDIENLDYSMFEVYFPGKPLIYVDQDVYSSQCPYPPCTYLSDDSMLEINFDAKSGIVDRWGRLVYNTGKPRCGKRMQLVTKQPVTAKMEEIMSNNGYTMYVQFYAYYSWPQAIKCGEGEEQRFVSAKISVSHSLKASFGDLLVSQGNPILGGSNSLSLNFSIFYLSAPMSSGTIEAWFDRCGESGLRDAVGSAGDISLSSAETDHLKFCATSGEAGKGAWDPNPTNPDWAPSETNAGHYCKLGLTMCSASDVVVDGGISYVVSFGFTNPSDASYLEMPPIKTTLVTDFGLGSDSVQRQEMALPGTKAWADSVDKSGLRDPMVLRGAGWINSGLALRQSTPFVSSANVLTLILQTTAGLQADSTITLTGFGGQATLDSEVGLFNIGSVVDEVRRSTRERGRLSI